ncbi:MAG TPA: hypothetical protein VMU69_25695 [Bradyrhizobium sp.]|nr:hypothetical protein [Bradyrhizobium sp.]
MVMIALCSSLVGAVLGTRFRVQALFPAMALAFLIVGVVAALKGATIWWAIAAEFICAVALQIGYLGGLLTIACMTAARVPLRRPQRSTARS